MPDYHKFSDDALLLRLRSGDEAAFTEIYDRYWGKLIAVGFYFTQDKQSAEDIVHEVLISLWIRKNKHDIKSLEAYLGTAVKFAIFKAIAREKRRHDLLSGYMSTETATDLEEKLDARFMEDLCHRNIEHLPEKARIVFDYSRSHGLTVQEIAVKMDLSPKAVEYHMTKALKALRNTLGKIKFFFI